MGSPTLSPRGGPGPGLRAENSTRRSSTRASSALASSHGGVLTCTVSHDGSRHEQGHEQGHPPAHAVLCAVTFLSTSPSASPSLPGGGLLSPARARSHPDPTRTPARLHLRSSPAALDRSEYVFVPVGHDPLADPRSRSPSFASSVQARGGHIRPRCRWGGANGRTCAPQEGAAEMVKKCVVSLVSPCNSPSRRGTHSSAMLCFSSHLLAYPAAHCLFFYHVHALSSLTRETTK
jgi:hypothetical protein